MKSRGGENRKDESRKEGRGRNTYLKYEYEYGYGSNTNTNTLTHSHSLITPKRKQGRNWNWKGQTTGIRKDKERNPGSNEKPGKDKEREELERPSQDQVETSKPTHPPSARRNHCKAQGPPNSKLAKTQVENQEKHSHPPSARRPKCPTGSSRPAATPGRVRIRGRRRIEGVLRVRCRLLFRGWMQLLLLRAVGGCQWQFLAYK